MIRLENVSKYYYSKGIIASGISKVSLELNIGEFVVITGESGSGKTTLLNVISGLDSYEEGEMYIDGSETSHYIASDFEEYRKKYIGNIFQNFNLVNSYTVYQNIELLLLINGYPKDEIKNRVPEIIKRVGLESHAKTKVSKLSGGQKQRVAIARALAKDTDIIVADEPTGNLDSVSAQGIVELLSEISHDKLVIVVTHNYDQFAAYATRKITMHDGSVVEDVAVIRHEPAAVPSVSGGGKGNITVGSELRLGVRNTFNIIPKFILLLIVFVFVVFSVTSQYTTFLNQKAEEAKLGFNDYFYNYREDRVVLKKTDGSEFTEDDFKAIGNVANVRSISPNDILLDNSIYLDNDDYSWEVYPRAIGEFDGKLIEGRMPEADDEAIFVLGGSLTDEDTIRTEVLDKSFTTDIGDGKEMTFDIVGYAYIEHEGSVYTWVDDLFITDEAINTLLKENYNTASTLTTTINGKEQKYEEGDSFYRIVPNSRVSKGEAIGAEELNNFYEKGTAKGKDIKLTAENMFYTKSITLELSDLYTKKTFKSKTGLSNYEENNGTIYISQADYDKLFDRGNFQATVYVNDIKELDGTLAALENMGYVTLPLKDTVINILDDITSVVRAPLAVIMVLAIFFIAYFVIRLIIRSRSVYFSILRMLGMAKKSIRRIMDVEMLLIVNIAYALFLICVSMVKLEFVNIEYVYDLVEYMKVPDYIVLYLIVAVMAYLISGKFARSLFKKTAMGNYREEE